MSQSGGSLMSLGRSPSRLVALMLCSGFLLTFAACGGQTSGSADSEGAATEPSAAEATGGATSANEQRYPDVVDAELEPTGATTYSLSVTISSPYDSPERYADGWRVLGPDGEVLGRHELMHHHANEQPFTRTQSGLEIPEGIEQITVEGRDLKNGYGGETVTVPVEGG